MMDWLAALGTAFLVGHAMKRGGLCTYAAVIQIVEQHRWQRLLVFLSAAAWAGLIVVPSSWLLPWVHLTPTHDAWIIAIVAGAVLGLGAVLNRGCFFGTFVQLVGGNLAYLGTLAGMMLGVVAAHFVLPGRIPTLARHTVASAPGPEAMVWLLATGLFAIVMIHDTLARWDPRPAAALSITLTIGIGGGLLYASIDHWSYASALSHAALARVDATLSAPASLSTGTAIAMVLGGIVAAIAAGSFAIRSPSTRALLDRTLGGFLMGMAARLVPGGNDGQLLQGIPALAPHAIAAYLTMLVVMWTIIAFRRRTARA